ncbi:hypothetical protein D082_15960 [Synechocystis sp. PCC 6714]|nr:hypothetical protein D082_15960 [Synechocystis sp. PCC 6714]
MLNNIFCLILRLIVVMVISSKTEAIKFTEKPVNKDLRGYL